MRKKGLLLFVSIYLTAILSFAQDPLVSQAYLPGSLALFSEKKIASIWLDAAEFPGCIRAATNLQADLEKVSGKRLELISTNKTPTGTTIIVGTIGKSRLIDDLIAKGKIDVPGIAGKWEST